MGISKSMDECELCRTVHDPTITSVIFRDNEVIAIRHATGDVLIIPCYHANTLENLPPVTMARLAQVVALVGQAVSAIEPAASAPFTHVSGHHFHLRLSSPAADSNGSKRSAASLPKKRKKRKRKVREPLVT